MPCELVSHSDGREKASVIFTPRNETRLNNHNAKMPRKAEENYRVGDDSLWVHHE